MAGWQVLGIGVDIVKISRFTRILEEKNGKFALKISARILHPLYELPRFQQLKNENNTSQCVRLLSRSWASKEALFKTLSWNLQRDFQFKQWYVFHDEKGSPCISSECYTEKNEHFLLSLSHDCDILVANVLRQRQDIS